MTNTPQTPKLEPSIIVIFGITGDLSQRFLLPALYHLIKDGLLHEKTEIIGISRRDISADQLLQDVELCINEHDKACDPDALKKMRNRLRMIQMDPTDRAAYGDLRNSLNDIEDKEGVCMNRLYYLSIPPQVYSPIIRLMAEENLNGSCKHGVAATRLLIEKPFGYDLPSAEGLIRNIAETFSEEQIFRIDHYLAKETVQNILTFRFKNPIFESLWSRKHIASIEVSASEKIGIEGRASFYEPLGALRDSVQSHLIQLLALVTMDRPEAMDSEHIHASKQAVLKQIGAVPVDQLEKLSVRGQYEGYRQEVDNERSHTETFAAIQLAIDSPRWQGVPLTLWNGKKLSGKKTEIKICFKSHGEQEANYLRFRIQPEEGIELDLLTKKPGFANDLQPAAMDFSYHQEFIDHNHPDAYERVLVDAVRGDQTLFATSQEVLQAWRIVQPVLSNWGKSDEGLTAYPDGAEGETLAQPLLK